MRKKKKDYEKFGRLIYLRYRESEFFFSDEDSENIMPLALMAGLAERVIFDPDIHGEIEDADPGQAIWRWL